MVELKSWSIVSTHTPSLERRRPLPESLDLRRHRQRPSKLLNSPQTVNPGPRLCQPNHLGIMYLTSALINKKQHNSLAETCVCLASAGSSLSSSSSNRFFVCICCTAISSLGNDDGPVVVFETTIFLLELLLDLH